MANYKSANLGTLPEEIKMIIAESLLPAYIVSCPEHAPSGDLDSRVRYKAQQAVDQKSIADLYSLISVNRSFRQVATKYLYEANQMAAIETQKMHESSRPCPIGYHIGPCVEPEINLDLRDPVTIRDEPQSVRSALDWIAGLGPEQDDIIEHVWAMTYQFCKLRHVHVALCQGNTALAERMLGLPWVNAKLKQVNKYIYSSPYAHPRHSIITTPSHPIFAAVSAPLLVGANPDQWAPAKRPAGIEFVKRLLPQGSPYIAHCRQPHSNLVFMAMVGGQLDVFRLLLDHAAQHSPDGAAIPSRFMAVFLWHETWPVTEPKVIFSQLRLAGWRCHDEGVKFAVRNEISWQCRGRAWLAGVLATKTYPVTTAERLQFEQLAWRDIFDAPIRGTEFRDSWDETDYITNVLWLQTAIHRWDVARIAQVLARFRNEDFVRPGLTPRNIGEFIVKATKSESNARALSVVRLLVEHCKEAETTFITNRDLKEARDIAVSASNWDLIQLLDEQRDENLSLRTQVAPEFNGID